MRLTLLVCFLLAGAAQARDCKLPEVEGKEVRGLRNFSECVLAEIRDLQRENTELRDELEDLRKSLASFPGELQNRNGRVTRLGGERLTVATFSLSSRNRESTTSLDIDQKALAALCEVGCSVTLALTAEGLREADTAPVVSFGPCGFRYAPKTGVWALGGGCGDPVSGVDGDGKPQGSSGGEIIATVGEVCLFADSEPSRSVDLGTQSLGRDHAKGLFLIVEPTLWKGEENRFRCELKIAR